MNYNIKLDDFEGPLDLLLNLIEKAKINIYDIPINIITQQYMEYIYDMKYLNIEIASEFTLMAATLLQIKSKMLLPDDPREDIDEDTIDPREELVLQLTAYKKYKEVSKDLKRHEKYESKAYYKPQEDLTMFQPEEIDLDNLDLNLILKSINRIIRKKGLENNINLHQIQRDKYSISECSTNITNILKNKDNIRFTELLSKKTNIPEIVNYFLSILELMKSQLILVSQYRDFSDLIISKRETGEI